MRKLIYSMGVSLDGFISGPGGDIPAPDEELHRFHNEQARATGADLYGRRLYEVMRYWETAGEQNPSAPDYEHEFERLWKDTRKLVFSRTLESVAPGYELVRADLAETVAALKAEPGGELAVGGAGLAASLLAARAGRRDPADRLPGRARRRDAVPPRRSTRRSTCGSSRPARFGSGAVFLRYEIA